jgi:glycosyltransferase involved in cell wall biosynthesis
VRQPRVLIASYYIPQSALDSSSRRLLHFIDFLLSDGWQVTVVAKNQNGSERAASVLRQRGVAIYPFQLQAMEDLLSGQQFDIAILAFWHIAEPLINMIRRLSPQTRIAVDSMDLHFVRHARRAFKDSPTDSKTSGLDASYADEMMREVNVYGAADGVIAVSQKEADLVNDLLGDMGQAMVVPDCEELEQSQIPFQDRRGIVFVGNFEHPPNAEAVRFLCNRVVPEIHPEILAQHPVYIVGRDLSLAEPLAGVSSAIRMVGWVPKLAPYLERARISVVPLLYGAGTKRKLIQTLMVGTPAVSTQIGLEGLALVDGKHVLVADEPTAFAAAIERLLTDKALWTKLARSGREHILALHNTEVAHKRLREAITHLRERLPRGTLLRSNHAELPEKSRRNPDKEVYEGIVRRIRRIVRQRIASDATVIVVSRGDPALVDLQGPRAWHFPRAENGTYAGFHPADSAAAIDHLENLRREGADYILFPSTSMWWLGHYRELSEYMFSRFGIIYRDDDTCLIFDLRHPQGAPESNGAEPATRESVELGLSTMPHQGGHAPRISVVIPTHNRASFLKSSLASLAAQSLGRRDFEVIVVDDGSTDETAEVCRSSSSELPLRYVHVDHLGIAAAKNAGTFAARGALVLYFDDDDIADRNLLSEHVKAHEKHPEVTAAVLGYTDWGPSLRKTEVMDFATNVGQYLFAYKALQDGQPLDFTFFWGGRASCKRTLFARYGLYRPEFEFGSEDIELAYRLSKHGFHVIYQRSAVQYMNRALTYDEFCRRCERQGSSLALFSRMHPDPVIQQYCLVGDASERWPTLEPHLSENIRRVGELERALDTAGRDAEKIRSELHKLYWWTFDAWKLKGVAEGLARLDKLPMVPSSNGMEVIPRVTTSHAE